MVPSRTGAPFNALSHIDVGEPNINVAPNYDTDIPEAWDALDDAPEKLDNRTAALEVNPDVPGTASSTVLPAEVVEVMLQGVMAVLLVEEVSTV